MEILSPYIIAGGAAWLVAHVLKFLLLSIKGRRVRTLGQLFQSGNMPSAHSATVIAVVVVIGFKDGVGSGLFGLAVLLATVVMYDAVMVRRSSGEQGAALTELIKEKASKVLLPRVAKGHTPTEVAAGALVGLIIGLLVVQFLIF